MEKDLRAAIARTVVVNITTAGGDAIAFRGTLVAVGRGSVTIDRADAMVGSAEARPVDGATVVPLSRVDWLQVV
ncbi:hypothetical protein [Georgenia sp. MJ170]|uniref:hypothetical protein n=1 Tax=Georgenia sunbinii TaxID=3117728 RepID=UPI002F26A3BB